MAQLIAFFLLFTQAQAQTLELLNEQSFESEKMYEEAKFGGISGLHYRDNILWAICDDRGSRGPYRLYKFNLTSSEDKKKWQVEIAAQLPLGDAKGYKVLDPEALYVFSDNQILISSEGDLNQKPRVMPMIRFWSEDKKWKKELPLPKEVLPEKSGMQTKGVLNNAAFEAMAVQNDEKKIWFMPEFPLFQNKKNEIEIFELTLAKNNKWKKTKVYNYVRNTPPEGHKEILRGMSDALWWKPDHILVLERSLRIEGTSLNIVEAELFSVKLLADGKVEKKKLLTLDKDLGANWEALSWGPNLEDGKRLLIIGSDNNFHKGNLTRFLFYSFKE